MNPRNKCKGFARRLWRLNRGFLRGRPRGVPSQFGGLVSSLYRAPQCGPQPGPEPREYCWNHIPAPLPPLRPAPLAGRRVDRRETPPVQKPLKVSAARRSRYAASATRRCTHRRIRCLFANSCSPGPGVRHSRSFGSPYVVRAGDLARVRNPSVGIILFQLIGKGEGMTEGIRCPK